MRSLSYTYVMRVPDAGRRMDDAEGRCLFLFALPLCFPLVLGWLWWIGVRRAGLDNAHARYCVPPTDSRSGNVSDQDIS